MWIALMIVGLAFADDPEFAGTKDAGTAFEKPEGALSAELGGALTTGNTNFWTANGTVTGHYQWQKNRLATAGGGIVGYSIPDTDGNGTISDAEQDAGYTRTAGKVFLDVRYDRFIGKKSSLYVLAGAFTDRFSGYRLRSHEQFGYSRLLLKNDTTSLVGEIGIDYAQEFRFIAEPSPDDELYANIIAGRILLGFKHTINKTISFEETLEVYENVLDTADLRVLNNAAITAKISDKLSMKVSNALIFDNQPVEGFRKLDQTTTLTLVAAIL